MVRPAALILVFIVVLTACGGGGSGSDETHVSVTLEDGKITLGQEAVPSGRVTFDVTNEGSMVHEFEIFSGDNIDLPISNGVADTGGLDLIDEVEDILPGGKPELRLALDPGTYIIICNLPGHYAMGMVAELTVTS
ncbi:MAG: cupredoxin domain-containing protein [Acidimicrobiia bacterium]